jgi:hypothetical protein
MSLHRALVDLPPTDTAFVAPESLRDACAQIVHHDTAPFSFFLEGNAAFDRHHAPADADTGDSSMAIADSDAPAFLYKTIGDDFCVTDATRTHYWDHVTLDDQAYLCLYSIGLNGDPFIRSVFPCAADKCLHLVQRRSITLRDPQDHFTNKGYVLIEAENIDAVRVAHKATLTLDGEYLRVFVRDLVWGLYKYIDHDGKKLVITPDMTSHDFFDKHVSSKHGAAGVTDDLHALYPDAGDGDHVSDASYATYVETHGRLHPILWELTKMTLALFNDADALAWPFEHTNLFNYLYHAKNSTVPATVPVSPLSSLSFADAYVQWRKTHKTNIQSQSGAEGDAAVDIVSHSTGLRYHENASGESLRSKANSWISKFEDWVQHPSDSFLKATYPVIKERVVYEITTKVMDRLGPLPTSVSTAYVLNLTPDEATLGTDDPSGIQALQRIQKRIANHNATIAGAATRRSAIWNKLDEDWVSVTADLLSSTSSRRGLGYLQHLAQDKIIAMLPPGLRGHTVDEKVTMRLLYYRPSEDTYWDNDVDKIILLKNAPVVDVEQLFLDSDGNKVLTAVGQSLRSHVPVDDGRLRRNNKFAYAWTTFDVKFDGYDDDDVGRVPIEEGGVNAQGQVVVGGAPCLLDVVAGIRGAHETDASASAVANTVMLRNTFAFAGTRLYALHDVDIAPDRSVVPCYRDTDLLERLGIAGRKDICTFGIAAGFGLFAYDSDLNTVFVESFETINRVRRSPLVALTGCLPSAAAAGHATNDGDDVRCWYNADRDDTRSCDFGRGGRVSRGVSGGSRSPGDAPGDAPHSSDSEASRVVQEEVWFFDHGSTCFSVRPDVPRGRVVNGDGAAMTLVNCNTMNLNKFIETHGIAARSLVRDGVEFARTATMPGNSQDVTGIARGGVVVTADTARDDVYKRVVNVLAHKYPVHTWELWEETPAEMVKDAPTFSKAMAALRETRRLSFQFWCMLVLNWVYSAGTTTFREHLYELFGHELAAAEQDTQITTAMVSAALRTHLRKVVPVAVLPTSVLTSYAVLRAGRAIADEYLATVAEWQRAQVLKSYFFEKNKFDIYTSYDDLFDISESSEEDLFDMWRDWRSEEELTSFNNISSFEEDLRMMTMSDVEEVTWANAELFENLRIFAGSISREADQDAFVANLGSERRILTRLQNFFVRRTFVPRAEAGRLRFQDTRIIYRGRGIRYSAINTTQVIKRTDFDTVPSARRAWNALKAMFKQQSNIEVMSTGATGGEVESMSSVAVGPTTAKYRDSIEVIMENSQDPQLVELANGTAEARFLSKASTMSRVVQGGLTVVTEVVLLAETVSYVNTIGSLQPLIGHVPYADLVKTHEAFLGLNMALLATCLIPGVVGGISIAALLVTCITQLVVDNATTFVKNYDTVDANMLPATDPATDPGNGRRLAADRTWRIDAGSAATKFADLTLMVDELVARGATGDDLVEYQARLPEGKTAVDLCKELQTLLRDERRPDADAADDASQRRQTKVNTVRRQAALRMLLTPWSEKLVLRCPAGTDTDSESSGDHHVPVRAVYNGLLLSAMYDTVVSDSFTMQLSAPAPLVFLLPRLLPPNGTTTSSKVAKFHASVQAAFGFSDAGDATNALATTLKNHVEKSYKNQQCKTLFGDGHTWAGRGVAEVVRLMGWSADADDMTTTLTNLSFPVSCALACYQELVVLLLDNAFLKSQAPYYTDIDARIIVAAMCEVPLFKCVLAVELLDHNVRSPGDVVPYADLVIDVVDLTADLTWDTLRTAAQPVATAQPLLMAPAPDLPNPAHAPPFATAFLHRT